MQKTNQREFRIEKAIKGKGEKLHVKLKGYNNSFNRWINKKDIILMSRYFPEPKSLVKVQLEFDLSNYSTKIDLKNATGIDTAPFA